MQTTEILFKQLGFSMKILADCINCLPFWVPIGAVNTFQQLNQQYREIYSLINSGENTADTEALLKTYNSEIQKVINKILNEAQASINDNLLSNELTVLAALYKKHFKNTEKTVLLEVNTTVQNLNETLSKVIERLQQIQAQVTAKLKSASDINNIQQKIGTYFLVAKKIQLRLYQAKQIKTDFSCISNLPSLISTNITLAATEYLELALLVDILKPEHVIKGLYRQLAIANYDCKQFLQQQHDLAKNFNLTALIRLQRIINVYQQWLPILQQQQSTGDNLSASLTLIQLLTYDKKSFLNKAFKSQVLREIIKEILTTQSKMQAENNDVNLIQYLQKQKQEIKNKTLALENEFKSKLTYLTTTLATTILAITKQPEYQQGQLAAMVSNDTFDQFNNIPIIGEKLPPELFQQVSHATGAAFLGISMYVSNKVGYSFQGIAFINRILLANINSLIFLGDKANNALQSLLAKLAQLEHNGSYRSGINYAQNALNFDELGLIEKEQVLHLTTGLFIQTVLTFGYLPALVGYIAAITAAETISSQITKQSRQFNLSAANLIALQVLSHALVYSYVYSYAYSFTAMLSTEPTNDMPQDKAHEIFGLGQYASYKEVQRQFRTLTRENNLNTCVDDCTEKRARLTEINAAYAVLKKGL